MGRLRFVIITSDIFLCVLLIFYVKVWLKGWANTVFSDSFSFLFRLGQMGGGATATCISLFFLTNM